MSKNTKAKIINDLIKKSGELKKLADSLAQELFCLYQEGTFDVHIQQRYDEISYQLRMINDRVAYLSA